MESKRLLKIPSQIRLKTEFFEGFGTQELIKTIKNSGGKLLLDSKVFDVYEGKDKTSGTKATV